MRRRSHNALSLPSSRRGFTLVELLVVIVVIAILAAVTLVVYGNVQDQARKAKVTADIAQLVQAIEQARDRTGETLGQIDGSYATANTCINKASGTNLAALVGTTDSCWTVYVSSLSKISAASGDALNPNELLDPYGRPYLIDENEGEGGGCSKDTVAMYSYPFTTGWSYDTWTSPDNVPLSGFSGCAT
jgi:prepilin-type N-terminal cleavage/methylation domain-containing protein